MGVPYGIPSGLTAREVLHLFLQGTLQLAQKQCLYQSQTGESHIPRKVQSLTPYLGVAWAWGFRGAGICPLLTQILGQRQASLLLAWVETCTFSGSFTLRL